LDAAPEAKMQDFRQAESGGFSQAEMEVREPANRRQFTRVLPDEKDGVPGGAHPVRRER